MAPVFSSLLFTSALFLPTLVRGANDWSKPCFNGVCSWDVDDGSAASGGITLSGSSNAISDITTAAGWEMLSCETSGTNTTMRIVCSSSDTTAAGCDHVEANGATNKLVRMPPGCGAAPFGRVANMTVSADQTIPSSTARRLHRRAGAPAPQVKQLALDIDWSAIPTSSNGQIEMYITGANVPGAQDVHNTGASSQSGSSRRSTRKRGMALAKRSFFSSAIDSIGNAVTGAAGDVVSGAQAAISAVTSVAGDATSAVASVATAAASAITSVGGDVASGVTSIGGDIATAATSVGGDIATAATAAAGTVASAVSSANTFNDTKTFTLDPVNFDKSFNLVNQSIGCASGKFSADLNVDGQAQANAGISVGVVAAGTIVPPAISQFQAIIGGNANFSGDLNLDATTQGKIATGTINLIGPIGITPFQIPGIFTVGPSISVTGQLTSELQLGVDMNATVNFVANNLQVFFPPNGNQTSSADTSVNSSPFQLALSPNVDADGIASLHLTPTLDLGINAFDNAVTADVFVDFDAALNLGANATALGTGAPFDGCANLTSTLSFNAGATGSFFGLFNEKKTVPIFSHTFDLFSKCFGGAADDSSSSNSTDTTNTTSSADAATSTAALSSMSVMSDAASSTSVYAAYSTSAASYTYTPASYQRSARSIQQRAATRRAEVQARDSIAALYPKRGPYAILAARDNSSCPSSPFSSVEGIVSDVVSAV